MSLLIRSKSLHREATVASKPQQDLKERKQRVATPTIGRRNWKMGKWLTASAATMTMESPSPASSGGRGGYFHGGTTTKSTSSSSSSSTWYPMMDGMSPPLRERQLWNVSKQKQSQAMTLVLKEIRDILPLYVNALSNCRFLECCTLLGSAMESSLKSSTRHHQNHHHNSKKRTKNMSSSTSPLFGLHGPSSPLSPGRRSPIRAWLTGSSNLDRDEAGASSLDEANVTAILETNLEVFFLITGSESMYMTLAHATSTNFATRLAACYEQAVKDLQLLRLSLLDASFSNKDKSKRKINPDNKISSRDVTTKQGIENDDNSESNKTATVVASSLAFLVAFCKARIQLIQLQSALWHSSPDFADMGKLFNAVLDGLKLSSNKNVRNNTTALVEPLNAMVTTEIGVWSSLCQTTFFVQHSRFAESIIHCQMTKTKILSLKGNRAANTKASCLELWLFDTLKSIIEILPIVFDKTSAFCTSLYSFNQDIDLEVARSVGSSSNSLSSSPDQSFRSTKVQELFETEVTEALLKYKKNGAISVGVIIDGLQTSNTRVEAGFCPFGDCLSTENTTTTVDEELITRQRFPAVYMRTEQLVQRSSKSSQLDTRSDTMTETRASRHSNLSKTSSPTLLSHKTSRQNATLPTKPINALQYGEGSNEGKTVSWPHSEWTTLVTFLTESSDDGNSLSMDGLDTARSGSRGPRVCYSHQTVYCIENVSESMWLVAILKNSKVPTTGWHWQSPPTTETVEDDLRELVATLSSTLRISDRFEASSVSILREKFLDRSSDEVGAGLTEEIVERRLVDSDIAHTGIIRLIKNQLRVLAQVNVITDSGDKTFPLSARSRLLRRGRRSNPKSRTASHGESAAALFLGRELMNTMLFE